MHLSCKIHDICKKYKQAPPTYDEIVKIVENSLHVRLVKALPKESKTHFIYQCEGCLLANIKPLMFDGKIRYGLFPVKISQQILIRDTSEKAATRRALTTALCLLAAACNNPS